MLRDVLVVRAVGLRLLEVVGVLAVCDLDIFEVEAEARDVRLGGWEVGRCFSFRL